MNRVEFAWLKVERSAGSSFSASPSETSPEFVRSWMPIEVIGTDEVRLGDLIRDPVTTTDWP